MRRFSLPENLIQAIGQYLVTKPFAEVRGLIQGLEMESKLIEDPKPEGKKPELKMVKKEDEESEKSQD